MNRFIAFAEFDPFGRRTGRFLRGAGAKSRPTYTVCQEDISAHPKRSKDEGSIEREGCCPLLINPGNRAGSVSSYSRNSIGENRIKDEEIGRNVSSFEIEENVRSIFLPSYRPLHLYSTRLYNRLAILFRIRMKTFYIIYELILPVW